ncbi:hypothetical protein ACKWTF_005114 [Chironomus riparius]
MIGIYKLTKEERDKSKYDKLPIVDNVDTKWSVFYDLFKQSRKMFSDSENVLRIQRSIKSKEILEIGGINLFDPRTYWLSLKLIDERLAKSFNLLYRETNEIIKIKKLRNDIESKKLIEFINKIINYSSIVERYGKRKHKMDERVISHIGNIMPYSLVNGWHKIKSRLEEKNKTVCIKNVAEYLSKQVPHINSKMQAEEIDPWKENNTKPFKKNDFQFKRSYNTHSTSDNNNDSINYCWMHKSKGHSSFDCSKLWESSGKEVTELARSNGICTFCGLKRHKDCHTGKSLNCKIENCNLKHHMLFCYKRPGKNYKNFAGYNKRNDDKNIKPKVNNHAKNFRKNTKSNETNNSSMSHRQDVKNESPHREDDKNNCNKTKDSDNEEIIIPNSNFYINQPPKTMKVRRNTTNENRNNHISNLNIINRNQTIRCEFFHNHNSLNKVTRSSSSILGVLVICFVESNEKVALLMDSGSTVSILEESMANKLSLPKRYLESAKTKLV